jgi:hypothetical protein
LLDGGIVQMLLPEEALTGTWPHSGQLQSQWLQAKIAWALPELPLESTLAERGSALTGVQEMNVSIAYCVR